MKTKTAEEVLNDVLYHTRRTLRKTNPEIEWEIIEKGIIKCMEEYARQSSSLSDEEIEKQADWFIEHIYAGYASRALRSAMIDMAKWARERQKGGKP